MASPGNQHCASCIDTLSFRISASYVFELIQALRESRHRPAVADEK